jgi:probable HAF family extracellular repeat protein
MRNRARMNFRHGLVMATALVAPAVIAGTTATFTPVGPLDANVLSMSADGSVLVGAKIFGAPAFRWTREGGTQNIGDAFGQVSVSRDGSRIVGDITFRGHTTAAIWQGGTNWRSLGGYPGSDGCPDLSDAFAVSDGGEVVVGLGWDGCDATGFRWEQATGMVSLGSLDGNASRANDLSANGQVIVGWDDSDVGDRRGARWVNGVESLLAQPGGLFLGGAEATNADGSVIVGGNAGDDIKRNRAYR